MAVAAEVTSGAAHARTLAIMHLAIHDALNAIEPRYEVYAVRVEPSPSASPAAAVAGAAHGALNRLFPAHTSRLDAPYRSVMATIADGEPKIRGLALGDRVAAEPVSAQAKDGFTINPAYARRAPAPGVVQPVPPLLLLTSALTGIAQATPFTLDSRMQFRAPGPPALASAAWSRDFNEVKGVEAANSTSRTADQTAVAHFWREASTTQAWNRVARLLAAAQGKDLWESTRLLALLNMAMADAAITVFESKYHYHFWRPVTAIRQAEADGNPDTTPDPPGTRCSPPRLTRSTRRVTQDTARRRRRPWRLRSATTSRLARPARPRPLRDRPARIRASPRWRTNARSHGCGRVSTSAPAASNAATQGRQVGDWVTQKFLRPVKR